MQTGGAWVCNLVFLLNLVTLPAQEGEPAHARGSAQKKKTGLVDNLLSESSTNQMFSLTLVHRVDWLS